VRADPEPVTAGPDPAGADPVGADPAAAVGPRRRVGFGIALAAGVVAAVVAAGSAAGGQAAGPAPVLSRVTCGSSPVPVSINSTV
jgi:hypothetical protein